MTPAATYFPHSLVGLIPYRLEMPEKGLLQIPGGLIERQPHTPGLVECIKHLAVDIELQLIRCDVANPHWRGILIASEPGDLVLGEPPFAGNTIHDLHLGWVARHSAQKPLAPGFRLIDEAGVHQGIERNGGITKPAEPVVPVTCAT